MGLEEREPALLLGLERLLIRKEPAGDLGLAVGLDRRPVAVRDRDEHVPVGPAVAVESRRRHPDIRLRPDEALVVSGEGGRLVTSGASTAWHDLALYLVARFVGPASAQALARYQLMQWHREGQAAFHVFHPPTDHGDAVVLASQRWIDEHHGTSGPVEAMIRRSGLPASTFSRRFRAATGHSPIGYVQQIRIERAKRQLETTGDAVERVSWAVGYEDAAAFRRVFRRLVGMTPGEYRRRFRLPDFRTSD